MNPKAYLNSATEAQIKKGCQDYLQTLQNMGRISHWQRMQAGEVVVVRGGKKGYIERRYKVQLCQPGTPDLLVVHLGGQAEYIEVKAHGKSLNEQQEVFHDKLELDHVPVHVVRSVDDLRAVMEVI